MNKKIFTLLTLLLCAVTSSWASTVDDLKTIATDYVFIADNITSNGTVNLTANTLYDGNVIFAPTANTVATNKGNSSIEEVVHLNSLRLKKTQDQLCFKVSGACTVTFYTQSHAQRGIQVGSAAGGTQYGSQTASTTEWSCNITAAGVVYLSSYTGDFYFAGFKVTFPKTGQPTIDANPTSATYNHGSAATALSVSATAASGGALSYQWYKNETNQSALEGEGATAISGANEATYTPSTASDGTTYYFCKVTEEGNANVATTRMAKVVVNPAGFNVTYSLGEVTGTLGTLPSNESAVTNVTIPVNKTLYKDGYTLTAWNDGTADHAIGSTFDITANTTLTPVFTENGASSYLGHNASTVTWGFQTSNGDPVWNLEGFGVETKGYYVAQTSVGGSNVDLLMTMDATNGKINNTSNASWAQMNENTVLTVPVIDGAVVKVYVFSSAAAPKFNGNDGDFDSTNKIYSYTATTAGNLDIVYGGNDYISKVTVEYPSESAVLTVSANDTKVGLTKTSIEAVDYLTAVTDAWQNNKTYGGYSGDFVNMSKAARYITIKVTGASTFEAFVQNTTADRTYTVKVGDGVAQEITHGGTGVESSGIFAIADPTAETTIKLAGGGSNANSVYPVYVKFNSTVEVTMASTGLASFASTYALDLANLPEGLKAYKASLATTSAVTLDAVEAAVPAGTGLIFKGTQDETYNIPVAASASALEGNLLVGVTAAAGKEVTANEAYALSKTDGKFHKIGADMTIPQGKAYLPANKLSARELVLSFGDGETTAINEVKGLKADVRGEYFNLNGQRVAQPTKGLYIVNGKKVVIK